MITVRGVVDRVGPTLLRALTLPGDEPGSARVSDVVIAESGNKTQIAAGDLVLGVGASTVTEATDLLRGAAQQQAAAVLLKPPAAEHPSVRRAAGAEGIGLIGVHANTSWAQLVWLLRTVLDAAADESDAAAGGGPQGAGAGDLFRLADAAAAVVDAPVTIEDANSRVLAYSARQDRTDPARVSTIMGRRVPDDVLARFRSRGVFRELSRGRSTIFVPAQADGTLPRLIVPIRIGGELLGSMWAVVDAPVAEDRVAAFADSGPVVALHLLRRRAALDTARKRSADAVRALLRGASSPRVAAAELRLPEGDHRVFAIAAAGTDEVDAEGIRLALAERLTAGIGPGHAVAEIDEVLYAILPAPSAPESALGATPPEGAWVSAGSAVPVAELPTSRRQAEETLGLLRAGILAGRTAVFERVWPQLALHRMATAAAGAGAAELGPLPALREHDAANGTDYVATLYHWLRHPGDPRAASRALSIHPNTLRYRMRRIGELTGANLEDADTRLALLGQLATLRWS